MCKGKRSAAETKGFGPTARLPLINYVMDSSRSHLLFVHVHEMTKMRCHSPGCVVYFFLPLLPLGTQCLWLVASGHRLAPHRTIQPTNCLLAPLQRVKPNFPLPRFLFLLALSVPCVMCHALWFPANTTHVT
ncbi:hypothetical protein QBC38DRAFT_134001 [Podospora fimiseda]|uniref:Uncharacterized protein n=1 Tax=Podospora fimiseda TaxID=252190 RepID=A0AAN6YNN4_9PEZI|nr:hypothetical protein QBC38DRAFT_134001 [Podospora fimiseda]